MKIVHLITFENGGAARAAKRLNAALCEIGEESIILVGEKFDSKFRKIVWTVKKAVFNRILPGRKSKYDFSNDFIGKNICKNPIIQSADIIHLHWVSAGFLSLDGLKKLRKLRKPVVWTLHDMHPFTGGCHYAYNCKLYEDKCGRCYQIKSKRERDFTTWNQNRKKKYINNIEKAVVIGCSNWITSCAKNSSVMCQKDCMTIPNCIDCNLFHVIDRSTALKIFGLEALENKKIILFGAMNSTSDERKGYNYLKEALIRLDVSRYACIVFGGESEKIGDIDIYNVGYLYDEVSLSILYNCADVFAAPSIQENLANTVMEALACGTPVAAFDIGGMSDLIQHWVNGYLSTPFDVEDFVYGIEECAKDSKMSANARKYVQENYSYTTVSKKYKNIYYQLLKQKA